MHSHNHDCGVCKHECLHYCPCCGKVYCCKCGMEWGGYNYWWNFPAYPTYPTYQTYNYPQITWQSSGISIPTDATNLDPNAASPTFEVCNHDHIKENE